MDYYIYAEFINIPEQKVKMNKKYVEVVWHGRGGQGAITASQLVAEAAYNEGFKGVATAPMFGAERRGAPVAAFLRLSQEPIRIFSQISDPGVVVILDPTLIPIINLQKKYRKDALLVINSAKTPEELDLDGFDRIVIADITAIAIENSLTMAGVAILNTPIIGAFVKLTRLISMDSVKNAIYHKFPAAKAELNFKAALDTFNSAKIYENGKLVK